MAELGEILLGKDNGDSLYEETIRHFLGERTLIFNREVDEGVIEDYICYILKWNKEDIDISVEKRKPIRILISSPGGNTFSANIMADVILQSKTPVVGVALDLVASASYTIYLACHERIAFENSSFLQHEGEISMENSRSKFKQTVAFFEAMETRAKDYILSRTKMNEDFYDSIYEQEFWFDSKQAVHLGVVHKIIGVDCSIDEILS